MTPRRFLFWVHLVVGIAIGLAIFFLAATGSLMAFQTQIIAWAERDARISPPPEMATLPPSALIKAATGPQHDTFPTSFALFADKSQPAELTLGQKQILLLDPYSGRILRSDAGRLRSFFVTVRDLHRCFALGGVWRERASTIKAACCLLFLLQIISGLMLWIPRQLHWQNFRVVLWPRGKTQGRSRDWSLHNVTGIWISLPVMVIVISGLIMAFPWATTLLYRAAGTPPPASASRSTGADNENSGKTRSPLSAEEWSQLDALVVRAKQQDPHWASVSFRIPAAKDANIVFTIDEAGNLPNARSRLTLDRNSSQLIHWEPFASNPRGRQWRRYARYIHTGEILGLPGEAIVFLTCIGVMAMVWTGLSLALRRLAASRKRNAEIASTRCLSQKASI